MSYLMFEKKANFFILKNEQRAENRKTLAAAFFMKVLFLSYPELSSPIQYIVEWFIL